MFRKINKILILSGIFIILNLSFSTLSYGANEKTLDLKTAISFAEKNSKDLRLIKLDLIKKNIERRQAKEGLDDIRKKESTVRFSLLFEIEFPETHGMPKEIELLLKLPRIDNEIEKLNMDYINKNRTIVYNTKTAYYNLLDTNLALEHGYRTIADLENTYKKIHSNYLKGQARKDDLKLIEDSLKANKDSLTKNLLELEKSKKELSDIIGLDVTKNYVFDDNVVDIEISRNNLKEFISHGLKNDYQIFTVTKDRKLAEKEVNEIYKIYKNEFGSKTSIIAAEMNKSPIDYDSFYQKYEKMLEKIDAKWKKVYVINLLFFEIKIPMRWFQGEYTALRYFEDQKYPLVVAVSEREKKRLEEKKAIEALPAKITNSYNILKETEATLKKNEELLILKKKEFADISRDNLLGKVDFAKVQEAKTTIEILELSIKRGNISKSKAIAGLNLSSSGAISKAFAAKGYIDGNYASGVSNLDDENSIASPSGKSLESSQKKKETWYLKTPYEESKFILGVSLPEESKITGYRLFANTGVAISNITPINQTIEHLPLIFEETGSLYLAFYENGEMKYKSEISGDGYQGELKLISTENLSQSIKVSGNLVGSYKVENIIELKASLSILINVDISYDSYRLEDLSGKLISSDYKKGEPLESLQIILYDTDNLVLKLIDGEDVYKLSFIPSDAEKSEGVLVIK